MCDDEEEQLEQYQWAWAREVFGPGGYGIDHILSGLDASGRRQLIQEIREACEYYDPDFNAFKPSGTMLRILELLCNSPKLRTQNEIIGILAADGESVSRKTVGRAMAVLEDRELIDYPSGPKSGARMTASGERFLKNLP